MRMATEIPEKSYTTQNGMFNQGGEMQIFQKKRWEFSTFSF